MERNPLAPAFALAISLLCSASGLSAQQAKIERAAFEALQIQRLAIAERLEALDPDRCSEIAGPLAEPNQNPFRRTAEAWLRVQGVEVDDDGLVRGGLMLFALPEVIDRGRFDSVALTVHAPRIVPLDGEIEFDLLYDRDGESKVVASIGPFTRDDILRFKATASVPLADFGTQQELQFSVRARIDGRDHRETDWTPRARVQVVEGFADRVQALPSLLNRRADRLEFVSAYLTERPWLTSVERGDLAAICQGLDRVWNGEPRWPGHEPLEDLITAESLLASAEARHKGDEESAVLPAAPRRSPRVLGLALPAKGARPAQVVRMTYDAPRPAPGKAPLCLLFATGAPSWDGGRNGPTVMRGLAPEGPRLLLDPGAEDWGPCGLAVVETPSGVRGSVELIRLAAERLREEHPDMRIVVAAERESGFAVSRAVVDDPDAFAGVALFSGGSFTGAELEALGDKPVLLASSQGHMSAGLYEWLDERSDSVERLDSDGVVWFAQLRQQRRSLLRWLGRFDR